MAPRSLHIAIEDVIHLSLDGRPEYPEPKVDTKRHAIYFPSTPSHNGSWDTSDAESTWDFAATAATPALSSGSASASLCSTASQEIAARYRAFQLGLPLVDTTRSSQEDVRDVVLEARALEDPSPSRSEPGPGNEIRARYRQSRSYAVREAVCFWQVFVAVLRV